MSTPAESSITVSSRRPRIVDGRVARRWSVVVGLAVVGWWSAGPVVGVGAASMVALGPSLAIRRRRSAARRRVGLDVASIFELAARAVRSGVPVGDALAAASASVGGFAEGLTAWAMSDVRSDRVIGAAGPGVDSSTEAVVTAVVAMVRGPVGGGARALEAGAALLREHARTRADVLAAASHARTSAMLLVTAPLLFAVVAVMATASSVARVFSDPRVVVALVIGTACEIIGAWWANRLVSTSCRGPS